ncbi:MAG: hypothetical protein RIR19_508 [Chloroflexota bacterium]|jgi:hypothetical protein|nr:MAG: hypothetical protein DWI45_01475 [Chloroflexota bacterium]
MTALGTLELVLIFVHLLGMAAIVGGYFAGISSATKRLSAGMVHGTLLQLVSGIAILGVEMAENSPYSRAKFGVKLLIVIVALLIAWPRRRAASVPASTYHAIGLLAITNVVIAIFWK